MSERKNPQTSIDAYKSLDANQLTQIYKDIISALGVLGEATFEEIAAHLKVDKSRVWKRMSELERMELVYRPGKKRLLKSGRNGYTWMLCIAATPKIENGIEKAMGEKGSIAEVSKNIKAIQDSTVKNAQISLFDVQG